MPWQFLSWHFYFYNGNVSVHTWKKCIFAIKFYQQTKKGEISWEIQEEHFSKRAWRVPSC